MIVDTSALVAIVFQEHAAERIARAIASTSLRRMSCANWLECMIVVQARRGPERTLETISLMEAAWRGHEQSVPTLPQVEARPPSDQRERPKKKVAVPLAEMGIEMIPCDEPQMRHAHAAWQRFGKGRHPARLNILDCCAYAAATILGEPLLYVGDDFAQTDIARAPW